MTVPIAELFFLIQVEKLFDRWTGDYGLLLTMALIVVTAIVGSYLAKREGLSTWNRLQDRLGKGGLPGDELLDAVIILIAGAFLITPGVLTDLVGFIGLVPLTRGWVRRLVKRRLTKAMREGRIQTSFGTFGSSFESDMMSPDDPTSSPPQEEPVVGGSPSARGPSPQDSNGAAPDPPSPTSPGARMEPAGSSPKDDSEKDEGTSTRDSAA